MAYCFPLWWVVVHADVELQVRRLVEQRHVADARARIALRRPAASIVPSPTSGWTTRAAQKGIWCGRPRDVWATRVGPSRTTWPNVRCARAGWVGGGSSWRIRRGASSAG